MKLKIFIVSLFVIFCPLIFSTLAHSENIDRKIVILPFENMSEDPNALRYLMPLIREHLQDKRFELTDEMSVRNFLIKERVRATGYVLPAIAKKIGNELGSGGILLGSVNHFSSGDNPQIAISARLIDNEGNIIWANYISITGEDFLKILGIGAIRDSKKLVSKAVERLFSTFSIYSNKDIESAYKIAVMPFYNKGRKIGAGKIVNYMFISELHKSRNYVPVEFGSLRNTLMDLKFFTKDELDYEKIAAISDNLNVDGIIIGTIDVYPRDESDSPSLEVEINARLINARKKRLLWSDTYKMNSDSEIYVFDWGKKRSSDQVAYGIVSKMVKKMEAVRW